MLVDNTKFCTSKLYSDEVTVEEIKDDIDSTTGVSYLPCIHHNLTYRHNCNKEYECYCYFLCYRLSLGVLK